MCCDAIGATEKRVPGPKTVKCPICRKLVLDRVGLFFLYFFPPLATGWVRALTLWVDADLQMLRRDVEMGAGDDIYVYVDWLG